MDLNGITAQISSVFDQSLSFLLICPKCKKQIPHLSLIHNTKTNTIEAQIKCICSDFPNIELGDYIKLIKTTPKNINHCNINEEHYDRNAVIYCSFCHMWLCQECLAIHKKSNEDHISFKQEIRLTCIEHKTKKLKWYCEDCKRSICKKCSLTSHNKHNKYKVQRYNVEKLLRISEYITQLMKINKDIKNEFVNIFTTSINQLTHWMTDIETIYQQNEINNRLLKDFFQIIMNTWSMTKEVNNFELKQTIDELQINKETKALKWDNLSQYHSKLQQLFNTQLALKLQTNGNMDVLDKKNKRYFNVISNEKELEKWDLVLFNQNEKTANIKPIKYEITRFNLEIKQQLIILNNALSQNSITLIEQTVAGEDTKISHQITFNNLSMKKNELANNKQNRITKSIANNEHIVNKSKNKHQSIDNTSKNKKNKYII